MQQQVSKETFAISMDHRTAPLSFFASPPFTSHHTRVTTQDYIRYSSGNSSESVTSSLCSKARSNWKILHLTTARQKRTVSPIDLCAACLSAKGGGGAASHVVLDKN